MKKARNSDAISTTTDSSADTVQTSTTETTVAALKQDILSTLRTKITQLLQQDLQPMQTEITSLQNTVKASAAQHSVDMQQIHKTITTSHEQFNQQMAQISDQFNAQLKAQQAQFEAQLRTLFTHLSAPHPSHSPPSNNLEGGMH